MVLTVVRTVVCIFYCYLLWLCLGGLERIMRVANFLTMMLGQKECKMANNVFSVNFGIVNAEK